MNIKLFEKFAQGIKENKSQFIFEIQEKGYTEPQIYSVVVDDIFGAKYVYYEYSYDREELIEHLINGEHKRMTFAMLVKDNKYLVDEWVFASRDETAFPNNVKTFTEVSDEYKAIYETEIKKFYNDIKVNTDFSEEKISTMRNDARRYQLKNLNVFDEQREYITEKKLSHTDILKAEIGYAPKEEIIEKVVKSNEKDFVWLKSRVQYIENLIANNDTVEQWEIDITKPLNAIKDVAKTVNVTFELNGITGSEKVEIKKVIDYVIDRNTFSHCSFSNGAKGRELLKKLNAKDFSSNGTPLTTENIVKITYGKNVLFEK
jgi:hypothetical protein